MNIPKKLNYETDQYRIAGGNAEAEIKIKGSRFLATIIPAKNSAAAEVNYEQIRKRYYKATHNCFAYRIDEDSFRYSDDGEPTGTAGKPILQSMDGQQIRQILCVVTRWYGGTKLGTGGLIRAYSQAAQNALDNLKIDTVVHSTTLVCIFNYDLENLVRSFISNFNAALLGSQYTDRVEMRVAVPFSLAELFCTRLQEASNSQVMIAHKP